MPATATPVPFDAGHDSSPNTDTTPDAAGAVPNTSTGVSTGAARRAS